MSRFTRPSRFQAILMPLQLTLLGLTLCGVIGTVFVANHASTKSFALRDEQEALEVIVEQKRELEILLREHQTLRHVEESARFLGFVPSGPPIFIPLHDLSSPSL